MQVIILHRPTDVMGGDRNVCESYARALAGLEVSVELRPADQPGDLSAADYVYLWAVCSPDWGLPAAYEVKRQGKPLIAWTEWWGREMRQAFYCKPGQDIAPGYLPAVAKTIQLADVLATCTTSEVAECWKLVPRKPFFVIGRGANPLEVEPKPAQDYVTCLARVEKQKNQFHLALACHHLGLKLILVGSVMDGYYAAKCEALGAVLLGGLPHKDAQEVLASARVHALVSFFEAPGMSSMEALQLGVPAVMGQVGAQLEYFGNAGIYCDVTSWQDIAEALTQAWNVPRIQYTFPTWEQVARNALEWMEAHQ